MELAEASRGFSQPCKGQCDYTVEWGTRQALNMKQAPRGPLTNDQGLSTHGQEPAAASWALLPDECNGSRPLNVPDLGVNES